MHIAVIGGRPMQRTTRRMWRRFAAWIMGGVVLTAGATAVAASVDNMIPTATFSLQCRSTTMAAADTVCQTDNKTLTFYKQTSLASGSSSAVNLTMFDSYNGTNLNVTQHSAGVYSGTAETDIIYQQGTGGFSGSTIGYTWCNNQAGGIWQCDQQYVKFRYTANRALACHETGHGVGLLHGVNSSPITNNGSSVLGCMVTPLNSSLPYIGTNNVARINGTYA